MQKKKRLEDWIQLAYVSIRQHTSAYVSRRALYSSRTFARSSATVVTAAPAPTPPLELTQGGKYLLSQNDLDNNLGVLTDSHTKYFGVRVKLCCNEIKSDFGNRK